MAIVADLSGNGFSSMVDNTLSSVNRTNAGAPSGSLTPRYVDEIVYDSTNKVYYKGTGTTANTQWRAFTPTR
jgi:hypothetical protein